MADNDGPFILEIEWDVPGLPSRVGPFDTREEARRWGQVNIPNGTWNVTRLAPPYARPRGERSDALV